GRCLLGLRVRRERRLFHARAPRRDHRPRPLRAAPALLPVDRLLAARPDRVPGRLIRVIHAREDAACRRSIATHGLAGSAATRLARVRRPAWPATPSRTRLTHIKPLEGGA